MKIITLLFLLSSLLHAAPLPLKIATFNIRYEGTQDQGWQSWPERVQRLVATIREMNPDCFGVQEALHEQMADLKVSLTDYESFGSGRDDAEQKGEYSAIFYKKEKFTADGKDAGMFWLSDTPEKPGSMTWGNQIPRIVTWLHLTENQTKRDFTLYNTHWDHQNQNSRERAAQLILDRIQHRKNASSPFILLGDFNSNETNPAVASITAAGLINTYNAIHKMPADRRSLHFWKNHHDGSVKIDHIFVPANTIIKSAEIIHPATGKHPPSDHFPVTAEITFP